MKDAGYWQAIDNLAYETNKLSDETQVPILNAHPELYDDTETALEITRQYMTPEQIARWDLLDTIIDVISSTYEVEFIEVATDAFNRMVERDLANGLL